VKPLHITIRDLGRVTVAMLWIVTAAGCASGFDPTPVDSVPFRDRAESKTERGVRVTTAVPSASETTDLFGISLYRKRLQPVWLEIENNTDAAITFFPVGLDRDYHSPIEVASLNRKKKTREQAEQYFFNSGVDMEIGSGETRSGFIFTNLDEGTKSFNVDILGDDDMWQFTFFIPVPGFPADHHDVDVASLYADDEISEFTDHEAFTAALAELPCCTVDAKAENQGDPLNLVIIGEPIEIFYAVIRADWDETEAVSAASGFKTVVSFFSGGAYRYSPVSSLYLFGRHQDIALQRIRSNIHERNHFRLWRAPMTFNGVPVWIGQISRDIGVRFAKETITTHKIDADVDDTREFLLENLAYSQVLQKYAYVRGAGEASIDSPRHNLTGDPYFTDGLRLVMWIASEPTDLENIGYEDWVDPEN
jgi:hypothetical protein